MAFVFTLYEEAVEGTALVLEPGATSITRPVGYDDEEDVLFQFYVGLDTAPGGITELSFCMIMNFPDGSTLDLWDSKEVASFIPSPNRHEIMRVLERDIAILIMHSHPAKLIMRTILSDLPDIALQKYIRIRDIIVDNGYTCDEETFRGQHTWVFDRMQL